MHLVQLASLPVLLLLCRAGCYRDLAVTPVGMIWETLVTGE